MENKQRLFLDIDDVVLNTQETIIDLLNERRGTQRRWQDQRDYQFKNLFRIDIDELNSLFVDPEFFSKVRAKDLALDILTDEEIKSNYEINFITIGEEKNLEFKEKYLRDVLGYDFKFIGILRGSMLFGEKASYDMKGGIQVDDVFCNLENTNARLKILLKNDRDTDYNDILTSEGNTEDLYVINTLKELKDILIFNIAYNL